MFRGATDILQEESSWKKSKYKWKYVEIPFAIPIGSENWASIGSASLEYQGKEDRADLMYVH